MAEKSKVCERILEIDGCFGVSGQTLAVKGRVGIVSPRHAALAREAGVSRAVVDRVIPAWHTPCGMVKDNDDQSEKNLKCRLYLDPVQCLLMSM